MVHRALASPDRTGVIGWVAVASFRSSRFAGGLGHADYSTDPGTVKVVAVPKLVPPYNCGVWLLPAR